MKPASHKRLYRVYNMQLNLQLSGLLLLVFLAADSLMADRYVAQSGQIPASPYDAWYNAASNIQAAVNEAYPGETVWVSNGHYRTTSSPVVMITSSLSLRSVATDGSAVIDGEGARRCVQIA